MSLLLRQLWYGGLLLPPVVQDDNPTPPGPDPVGKHIIGLASGVRNGKLLIATQPTRCEETQIGDVYLGLVSGVRDEKPLLAVVDQRCGEDVALEQGQTYLGLVSGVRDDKPLLVVPCSPCNDDPDGPPIAPSPCCARLLPATLSGRILRTTSHDTEVSMYYHPAFLHGLYGVNKPPQLPWDAIALPQFFPIAAYYRAAWWSDLYEDYTGSVSVSGSKYIVPPNPFWLPFWLDFTVTYTFTVYYYVVYGLRLAPTPYEQNVCEGSIIQCCYPTGNFYYDPEWFAYGQASGAIPLTATNPEPISYTHNINCGGVRALFGTGVPQRTAVTGWGLFTMFDCAFLPTTCAGQYEGRGLFNKVIQPNWPSLIKVSQGTPVVDTTISIRVSDDATAVFEFSADCTGNPSITTLPRLDIDRP